MPRGVDADRRGGGAARRAAEGLAPHVVTRGGEARRDGVLSWRCRQQPASPGHRAHEVSGQIHVAGRSEGHVLQILTVGGVPEALAPHGVASRVELGEEHVAIAGAGEDSATEVDGSEEVPSNQDGPRRVDRDGPRHLHRRVSEAFAPDVVPRAVQLDHEDVVAARRGQPASAEVDCVVQKSHDDRLARGPRRDVRQRLDPRAGDRLGPGEVARSVELGDVRITEGAHGRHRAGAQIERASVTAHEDRIPRAVHGRVLHALACGVSEAFAPDVAPRRVELRQVDVAAACVDELIAIEGHVFFRVEPTGKRQSGAAHLRHRQQSPARRKADVDRRPIDREPPGVRESRRQDLGRSAGEGDPRQARGRTARSRVDLRPCRCLLFRSRRTQTSRGSPRTPAPRSSRAGWSR